VIRVRGGDLKYSDAERKAVMRGAHWARWLRDRDGTSISNEVEVILAPPGSLASQQGGEAQVERMTAKAT